MSIETSYAPTQTPENDDNDRASMTGELFSVEEMHALLAKEEAREQAVSTPDANAEKLIEEPSERMAKEKLGPLIGLRIAVNESMIEEMNKPGKLIDRVLDAKDITRRKATFMNQRQNRLEKKVAKLGSRERAEAMKHPEGSRKAKRLAYKNLYVKHRLKSVTGANERITANLADRSTDTISGNSKKRERMEAERAAEIQRQKQVFIANKVITKEKKRRRGAERELRSSHNIARREAVREEIKTWEPIDQVREKLMETIDKNFQDRLKLRGVSTGLNIEL